MVVPLTARLVADAHQVHASYRRADAGVALNQVRVTCVELRPQVRGLYREIGSSLQLCGYHLCLGCQRVALPLHLRGPPLRTKLSSPRSADIWAAPGQVLGRTVGTETTTTRGRG